MEANKFDGWSSNSLLTLLIRLQCSDNDFGGGDVSSDVLYGPGGKVDLIRHSHFKMFFMYAKRNKKDIGDHKCVVFWYGKS